MSTRCLKKKKFLTVSLLAALMTATVMANAAKDKNVLLQDGKLIITKDDMIHYVNSMIPEADRSRTLASQDRMSTLLQNIYVTRALALRADEFGVSIDQRQIEWEQDFKRDTNLAVAVQDKAVQKALENVDWDSLAKEEYLAASNGFMSPAQVDAAHILIATENRSAAEALELADEIRRKAIAGEDFNALAKQFSEDKTAATNGGELGLFKAGAMVKPFSEAVFAMTEPGSISEPVKSQFGYHIIKLNKKIPAQKQDFETAKPKIIQVLKARISAQARDAILTDTRSKPEVKVNRELFDEIRKDYVGQAK